MLANATIQQSNSIKGEYEMTKTKRKLTTLVLSVIMVLTLCIGLVPMFSMTAFAAATDLPVGNVTLKDTDADELIAICRCKKNQRIDDVG